MLPQLLVPTSLLSFLACFYRTYQLSSWSRLERSRLGSCDSVFEQVRFCVEMAWKCPHAWLWLWLMGGQLWFRAGLLWDRSPAALPWGPTMARTTTLAQSSQYLGAGCNSEVTWLSQPTTNTVVARAELPSLPGHAEHDPSGGNLSKSKRCKIAF